jgi:hypothetical protein
MAPEKQRNLMEPHDSWKGRWIVFRVLGLLLDIGLMAATITAGENSIESGVIIAAVRNIQSSLAGIADLVL